MSAPIQEIRRAPRLTEHVLERSLEPQHAAPVGRFSQQLLDMHLESRRMAKRHINWRPGLISLVVLFPLLTLGNYLLVSGQTGPLGWYVTAVWSWPIVATAIGIYGVIRSRRQLKREHLARKASVTCQDHLIVVVPTIGRNDTYPALERSVLSYVASLPECFPRLRIDVVVEEGCEAQQRIGALAASVPHVRMVVVPKAYATPNGTRFKARANHYSHELRIAEGEARDDVWVLHMDDDTGLALDSAIAMANFIEDQRAAGDQAKHLAQGLLTYPRENAANRLTWYADAVRPADDVGRFSALTGHGRPLLGLHGELLLVRASVEASIGWDFGPKAIVEDAQMALTFSRLYPGRSGWFGGRCYGASPASVNDFIKQRERWAWGLVGLANNKSIPLRHRLLLKYCVFSWIVGPLQNVFFVLWVGLLLGDPNTSPVAQAVLPIWGLNFAFSIWQYWEGLRINAMVSKDGRRRLWEPIVLVALIPLLSLLEGVGGIKGFLKYLRNEENKFVVIAKPV